MKGYIEIKMDLDGVVYRYAGCDVNRTLKYAKKQYMAKIAARNAEQKEAVVDGP